LNFSNKITYLNDNEVDQIIDNNQSRVEIDLCNLDKEEKMIYYLRINKKLSQKEIADRLNINQSTISRRLKNIMRKIM
jgi:RNA polymerase sigma factor (sigma-70 family)